MNGQPVGPFEPNELLAQGLTGSTKVWNETMPNWTPASDVPELASLLNEPPSYPAYPSFPSTEVTHYVQNSYGEIPPRPEVSKGKSILGLFGVTPLGVLGLVFGGIANKKYDEGDYEGAERNARLARNFGRLGFIFFFVTWAIVLLFAFLEFALISTLSRY